MTQNEFLPEHILIPFFGDEPIVGVEIGVLGASGSVALLNRLPGLKLYCIDPWKHSDTRGFEAERSQEWHDETYEGALQRLEEFGDRVEVLRMTSDEALKVIEGPFDFIWIDGDHTEDQVRRDFAQWQQRLKPRSIIGGHDYQIDYIAQIAKEELGDVKLGEDFTFWKENE